MKVTDNLRIERDGVLIEATESMLRNHYDKVVELAHLAIRGTPVQPAGAQAEPAQNEKGAALAKAFVDAAKSENPESALRAIRDSLGGGGKAENTPSSRPSSKGWFEIGRIRTSAMSHAGLDTCVDGGLSGLKQDMMSLASKLNTSDVKAIELQDAIRDVGFALREAGIEFEFDAAMPRRNASRMIDAIGVARRRGLTLK